MGSEFLRLPARASRDGDQPGEVVGTAIHVELLGYSAAPPYLAGKLRVRVRVRGRLRVRVLSSSTLLRLPTWQVLTLAPASHSYSH